MNMQRLMQYRNERNPFCRRLGIMLEELRPGYAKARKMVERKDTNPLGRAHGGIYFTMADSVAGSAAYAYGYKAVTVNASWNFFRGAVPGDVLTAEALERKRGKSLCVLDVNITDQSGALLGTGTFTFYLLPEKLDL